MRVLGIDPGTIRMGVGVLETGGNCPHVVAFESIALSPKGTLPEKLKEIFERVRQFVETYRPDVMALENVFFGKNVSSLVKIGEARASAMLAAAQNEVPVVEYPPARVKQAISGNGQASKVQVQKMIKLLLGLPEPPPVDAADALAVAWCHLNSHSKNVRFSLR